MSAPGAPRSARPPPARRRPGLPPPARAAPPLPSPFRSPPRPPSPSPLLPFPPSARWPPLSQLRVTRRLSGFTTIPFLPLPIFRAFSERALCPEQLRLPGGGSEPPATPGLLRTGRAPAAVRRGPGGAAPLGLGAAAGSTAEAGGTAALRSAPAGEKVPRVPPERPGRAPGPRQRLPLALGARRAASRGRRERAAGVPAGAALPSRPGAGAPEPGFLH